MTLENNGSTGQAPEGEGVLSAIRRVAGDARACDLVAAAGGLAALESAVHNELVLYRSEAVDGTPIGVSGIVALPRDAPPEQGYPVVSWAHGAARQLYPQISDRPAIVGHSQGGQAALFTPLI
jgi:hypothetical protein